MDQTLFYIWLCIASIQIVLFTIYLIKHNSKNGTEAHESIDIVPLSIYNGMAYWKEGSHLCRTPYSGKNTDMSNYEVIDPLNSDMSPAEVIGILESLENVK